MKFSQIAAVLVTLLISLGVVVWLASTVPPTVFDDSKASAREASTEEEEVPFPTEEGVHRKNPLKITTEGPQPKAVVEEELFNFGKMALGQKGTHDFVIKNNGEAPLLLAKGPVQCKCTISGLKEETVAPGGEAKIHLEYEPKSLGEFGQQATIWTNDPENSELHLRVEGTMVNNVIVIPSTGWNLGSIPSQNPVKLKGSIHSAIDESFEITSIETSSDAVKLEAVPMSTGELEDAQALAGYQFLGSYQPTDAAGAIQEFAKVHTTLKSHPVIEFQISGNRSGPIAIIGPGWTSGNRTLDLGRIPAEKGKTQRLTLMLEPAENEIEMSEMTTSPNFVKASVTAEKNAPNAPRQRFTLIVEVPKDSPKGLWNEANLGRLSFKTTHPDLKEITINLMMTIQ